MFKSAFLRVLLIVFLSILNKYIASAANLSLSYRSVESIERKTNPLSDIRDFKTFLEHSLNKNVSRYTLSPLTKPGENYGAVLQSVEVIACRTRDCDEEDVIELVVKTSVLDPTLSSIFKPELSFVKETRFYTDIIPAIEQFERDFHSDLSSDRLNIFIPCLGSRISLNLNSMTADNDAVLLLENMKFQNYSNVNRFVGLDAEETRVILKNMAKFHALLIGMRKLQPSLFNASVRPYCNTILHTGPYSIRLEGIILKELKLLTNITPELRIAIVNCLHMRDQFPRSSTPAIDTAYTTLIHGDLWINNIMLKKDTNSTSIKIYDFQFIDYRSFVHDLVYFLFTSVGINDMENNFKFFIDHYIKEFLKTIDSVGYSSVDYTHEKMWEEIRNKAKLELFDLLWGNLFILTEHKSEVPQITQPVLDRWNMIIEIFNENGFF